MFCNIRYSTFKLLYVNKSLNKILRTIIRKIQQRTLFVDFSLFYLILHLMYRFLRFSGCCISSSHCAFSSNLFHRQILQIFFLQRSDPEKKCSPWKVFGINHPQCLQFLSRRGPRSPGTRLSQHTLTQKWHSAIFKISAEKSFLVWQ